jgi:nicotinic acid mononucleotide adenylyltransferase
MKHKKYIWFGGSFSPPTFAHIDSVLEAARKLHGTYPLSKIIVEFVPVNMYYDKESVRDTCISEDDRLEMLKVMVAQLKSQNLPFAEFKIGTYELDRGKKTRKPVPLFGSVKLMEKANKTTPENIYIVLRQHTFESILRNKLPFSDRLASMYNFIVLPTDESVMYNMQLENRLLESLESTAKEMHGIDGIHNRIMFASPRQQVASMAAIARQAARAGQPLGSYTLGPIADTIRKKRLYKAAACFSSRRVGRRTFKRNRR